MTRHRPIDGPAIPDDSAPVPPAHRPTRWNVRTVRRLAFVCVGLALALSLVATWMSYRAAQESQRQAEASQQQSADVNHRLQALEDYVAGKGEQRDAETRRLDQRITQAACSVLDRLPAGEPLDDVRAEFRCGPGQPAAANGPAGSHRDQPRPSPGPTTTAPRTPPATTPPAGSTPAPPSSPSPPPPTPQPTRGPVAVIVCGLAPSLCPPP